MYFLYSTKTDFFSNAMFMLTLLKFWKTITIYDGITASSKPFSLFHRIGKNALPKVQSMKCAAFLVVLIIGFWTIVKNSSPVVNLRKSYALFSLPPPGIASLQSFQSRDFHPVLETIARLWVRLDCFHFNVL